jgi:hypothetical protein
LGAASFNKRQPALAESLVRAFCAAGIGSALPPTPWSSGTAAGALGEEGFAAAVRAAGLPTTGPDRITPHVSQAQRRDLGDAEAPIWGRPPADLGQSLPKARARFVLLCRAAVSEGERRW